MLAASAASAFEKDVPGSAHVPVSYQTASVASVGLGTSYIRFYGLAAGTGFGSILFSPYEDFDVLVLLTALLETFE